ncbi:MAG: peptide deformylase [Phycisphaerae bacterium]|nr:peptide deformylase [Phycisphaerae bacterium]
MTAVEKIAAADLAALSIIKYPDPRLREMCTPIEAVDRDLLMLVGRMSELMFANRGVGLAASQVGVTVRLFLASPNFDPDDLHVYINPRILSGEGSASDEEGCLSFPGIFCKIKRRQKVVIEAIGLDGQVFQHTAEDLHARICQHELDHLDGQLLVDRMGSVARLAHRKSLAALEEQFAG